LVFKLKALLKSFNLSDDAINIYLKCLGKFPYTIKEIQAIIPNVSEEEVKHILNELIEKKLIFLINPKYSESVPHYIIIPPFAAMLDNIRDLTEVSEKKTIEDSEKDPIIEKFQELLYQDLEEISGDLIELLSNKDNLSQTAEILSEVEENVKNFARVILNDVLEMILPLRLQSAVDARDFSRLINSVKIKVTESQEIVSNMFSQFREIVKSLNSSDIPVEFEAFKTFIRRLRESIDKRVKELSLGTIALSSEKILDLENSLYKLLTIYIKINKDSSDKFWIIRSYEKIKEILSVLLEKCKEEIIIIVPTIENFIPLEKFNLDYSEDLILTPEKKPKQKKSIGSGSSITKNQKKKIEEKINLATKKVAELKGFELSHHIADVLSFISDINPESIVIESIQGWLNRLLVIRKHLDPNTQYLLLEDIEKWKNNYPKIKKIEEKLEKEVIDKLKSSLSKGESKEEIQPKELNIKIISSDSHENKNALALAKKANIDYLQFKKNNIFAIIGDNSSLVFGIYQKTTNKPFFEISGFFTTYKPIIDALKPSIMEITHKARYPKDVEINRGFNDIIEHINDYSGKEIGQKLKNLLEAAFEKDGISLDILELKLLIGKLKNYFTPLDIEMKEYVINELNKLNKKFSSLELIYPPEFRPSILKEKGESELHGDFKPPQIELLNSEKLDNLFELFLEKIDNLKGAEIGEQIEKFIEIVLKLQGYSQIIEWKNTLRNIDEPLKEPFKEKIKEDLLNWKLGILQQADTPKTQKYEESNEVSGYSSQESVTSIFEEDYISPGLAQSQFGTEEDNLLKKDELIIDPKTEMRELFNEINLKIDTLNGTEISTLMQNLVNIILETEGYSMTLKGIKDWISKLRKIKEPLKSEFKDEFQFEFLKWKEKFTCKDGETNLDYSSSHEMGKESIEIGDSGIVATVYDKFKDLEQNAQILSGDELSYDLENIANILLKSHGAAALNVIRQWISKLRSIKEPLADEIKNDFLTELENWKQKFS